ncbi:MAG: ATP-grasp domain-containing protein, partial [Acidobacteriota bacterium]
CLWEPGMLIAAKLREVFGLPGMSVAQTVPFRDKEQMKQVLDAAGVRTPRHAEARSEDAIRQAVARIGYPIILKPIAGAGSADTYRVGDDRELARVLPRLRHVASVSVEEFVEGQEYTYDTICADGRVLYENIAMYRPNALVSRSNEWISPQTISLRRIDADSLAPGRALGRQVLEALGFRTGFTHMEWFLTPGGEAVFGEIGGRPPGARSVDLMNYASDIDVYVGWAEALVRGRFSQRVERTYNAACIFKRAQGQGRIRHIEGLADLQRRFGAHIAHIDLLPIGATRRNWKQTLVSDGYLVVRHPDLSRTLSMADAVGRELQLYAV